MAPTPPKFIQTTNQSAITTVTPTTRGRKTTASKPLLSKSKEIENHLTDLDVRSEIKTSIAAKKLLLSHGLDLPIACNAIKQIAHALLEYSITAEVGATHVDILRSMAILLIEAEKNLDAANLIEKFTALIQGPIAQLEEKATRIEEATTTQIEALENAAKELRGTLSNSSESIEKAVQNVTKASQDMPKATHPEGMQTYANAVKTNAPPPLTKLLARGEAQARQILLDRRSYGEIDTLRGLTEAELVAKAKLTLELVEKDGFTIHQGLTFQSARRLPHGGILYELDSVESTTWLSIPAHRARFATNFGSNATIKDRSYHVLVENVPTSYDPSSIRTNSNIETNGGLKPGTIAKAKWIKPIARRKLDQRTAHTIITLKTKESANQILRFGISIEGKKVFGRKLLPEPTHCLKCQSFNGTHIAAECPQDHDTCGTCGAHHRTATCKVDDPNYFQCANCDCQGHASWSRDCPSFISKWESFRSRSEDSKYRFFPTEDPLTWETTENNTEQWTEPPRQPAWTQPATDTNTHGNYGRLLTKIPQPQSHQQPQPQTQPPRQPNTQPEQQKRRPPRANPNRIPIGLSSQARLMDNWLNSQPTNENDLDPHAHLDSTPQISSTNTTPLWFPPSTPDINIGSTSPSDFA